MAKVSLKIPTVVVKEIIEDCYYFSFIDDIELDENIYPKIFLNGILLGITKDPKNFIKELKEYHNNSLLDKSISFTYNKEDNEVKIFSDEGRLLRPVFTVDENNKLNIKEDMKVNWKKLVDDNYIKYIDNCEVENSVIAMDQNDLEKFKCDYCEIHPSMMMGIMSNNIPFPEHSQCIFKDEPVYMSDGTTKRICDVEIGDKVITFDPDTKEQSITTVIHTETHSTEKELFEITTYSNRKIIATFDHRFMTSEGWKRLEHLKVDNTLIAVSLDPYLQYNEISYNIIKDEYDKCDIKIKNKLNFDEWKNIIQIQNRILFIPILSITKSKEYIISDITVDSKNQSFLCGDTFCVHNSPRNIYQSSMGKQAIGLYATSFQNRADTITYVLNYLQRPLVSTLPSQFMGFNDMPMGMNVIVAVMTYGGWGQEDAVILNKGAIDRGLFHTTSYRTLMTEEKKQGSNNFETICMPPIDKRKKNANYSFLDENGIIKKRINGGNVYVEKGDVIIGKTLTKSNKSSLEEEVSDISYVIKSGEEGFIDRIFETITPNGYKMVKVVIRNNKIPEIGDKLACYDSKTEILTKNGWKFVNNITLKDEVACLIDHKRLEYHKPTETQEYDYKGKMYSVESDKVSLLVTPNHRMYTGNCHRQNYNIQRADEIFGKMRSYKNNIEEWIPNDEIKTFILPGYEDLPDLELDLEAWCIFFGIWIAEGSCNITYLKTGGVNSRYVNIAANKERVKENLEKCMKIIGLKWNYHMEKGELNKWYCSDLRLIYYLKHLSVGSINKSLPEWCFNLDIHHSQKLIEGMCLGDGDFMKETTTVRYYTSSIKLRDDFQMLCLHAGWGCNYYLKSEIGSLGGKIDGRQIISTEDHWSLTVCKSQTKPLVNKYIKDGKQLDSWKDFDDKVYCCTVPTKDGVIFVRRNGKSLWCANSRAAQKGTVGMIYAQQDMPFTPDGITPDLILNAHAIPSRMTINVLLETLLGKSCLLEGTFGDATPFTSNSTNIVEKLCDRLESNGYERHGWEELINGFSGEPIKAKIFCFEKGTKVLMGDCNIKNIEDINIGEYVMGADGKPKIVTYLPRGRGKMYHIKPLFNTREDSHYGSDIIEEKGYTVNEDHYLVLYTNTCKYIYKNEKRKAFVITYPEIIFDEKMGFERLTKREKSFCWDEEKGTVMFKTSELAEQEMLKKRDELIKLGCSVSINHKKKLNTWSVFIRRQPSEKLFVNERVLLQINAKTDEEIARFKCVTDAGQVLGIDPSGISKVCTGKSKICGGFKWKYEESTNSISEPIEKTTYSFKYGEKSNRFKYKSEEDAYNDAIELFNKINDDIEWKVTVKNYLEYKNNIKDEEVRLSWCSIPLETFSSPSKLNIEEFIENCYIESGNKDHEERISTDMFGWLLGLWSGDGKDNLIFIDYQQTDILNRCKEVAKQLNVIGNIKILGEGKKEHYHFTFSHENENKNTLIVMLKKLGIYKTKEFNDELTSNLMNQSLSFRQKILEGMIDADGHLPNTDKYNQDCEKFKRYYVIGQSPLIHRSSMLMIRMVCRSLGIKSTIRKVIQKSGQKLRDMWSMCISGSNLINIKPSTKYKQMPKGYFDRAFKDTFKIQFEIVEKDENNFFGISIEDGSKNNFLLADFNIVSNCGPTYYQRLKHMVADKIHCLDVADTSVLTLNGWKTAYELNMNDYIATLKDEKLVYEKPIDMMIYPDYEGSMYYIKNQAIDLAVTGNHRMWVSKPFGPERKWQQYDFARADEIVGKHLKYKKDAIWEKEDYQFVLPSVVKFSTPTVNINIEEKIVDMNAWLTFFGIWYVEGCTSGSDTSGYVYISVNKQRVKDLLYPVLDNLGYKFSVNKDDRLSLYDYQLYRYMKSLSVGAPNKELPLWVFELSKEQTRVLIRGMILGDSSSTKKNSCEFYYTNSVKLADQFQQLCLHAGWTGIISTHIKWGKNTTEMIGKEVINNYDVLRISVITKRLNPIVNHEHTHEQKIQEEKYVENEKCPVFCLQVPSEVFYIRRNGKACWTGNSRANGDVTLLTRQPLPNHYTYFYYPPILIII